MNRFLTFKKYIGTKLEDIESFKLCYAELITEERFEFNECFAKVKLKINNDKILLEAVEDCILRDLFVYISSIKERETVIELHFITNNKIHGYKVIEK